MEATSRPDGEPGEPKDFTGSVTAWLHDLKAGNPDAARRLWARYFLKMTRFGRTRLWGSDKLAADEEDVALDAFESFCRAAGAGRFPNVQGRDELWRVLAKIIARKAANQVTHEQRKKRGGDATRADDDALGTVESPTPSPELAAQMAEEFQMLLERLPDASLRAVAVLKLEGHTRDEIAQELGCGVRTVERKLLYIRRLWSEAAP